MNIRFQVYGKEKVFPTKDVLSIGFTNTAVDASSSAAPPVAGAASIDAPRADLSDPPPTAPAAQQNAQSIPSITIPSETSVLIRMIDRSIPRNMQSATAFMPVSKAHSRLATLR